MQSKRRFNRMRKKAMKSNAKSKFLLNNREKEDAKNRHNQMKSRDRIKSRKFLRKICCRQIWIELMRN